MAEPALSTTSGGSGRRAQSVACHRDIQDREHRDFTVTTYRHSSGEEVEVYGNSKYYVVSGDGEAPPGYDDDWTRWAEGLAWQYLTEMRHNMMKVFLQANKPVQYRSSGKSLEPLVYSGDVCFLWPITGQTKILVGDIVFCQVQPNDGFYTHFVWSVDTYWKWKDEGGPRTFYMIGNNMTGEGKRCNGWCYLEHVFGILVKTQRGQYDREKYTYQPAEPAAVASGFN